MGDKQNDDSVYRCLKLVLNRCSRRMITALLSTGCLLTTRVLPVMMRAVYPLNEGLLSLLNGDPYNIRLR